MSFWQCLQFCSRAHHISIFQTKCDSQVKQLKQKCNPHASTSYIFASLCVHLTTPHFCSCLHHIILMCWWSCPVLLIIMSFHDNYTLNGPLMSQSVSLELLTKCRNDGLMPAAITITWSRHVIPLKRGGAATLDQPSVRAELAHLIVGTPCCQFRIVAPLRWRLKIVPAV